MTVDPRLQQTLAVLYSCHQCGIKDASVSVRVREPSEDVVKWMQGVVTPALQRAHAQRSPFCRVDSLSAVKIPITGADHIGGPPRN